MAPQKGNVRTTYVTKVVAITSWSCTTPTKPTTMQGRQVSVDYTWLRSTHLRRRPIASRRAYKDTTVHSHLEGYFHFEACDYSLKGAGCALSGEKTLQLHDDNSISISLEPSYWDNMLRPYNLHGDNVKTVTTTCLEQQPLEEMEKLDPQQHKMFRTTVGQLILGEPWQARLDVLCKTTFVKTTGANGERPTFTQTYLTVFEGNNSLQALHWQRLSRLPTYQPQRHCLFPAEQHSIGHTLFYRFRLGRRQDYKTFYKWLALTCSLLGTPLSYASRAQQKGYTEFC